MSAVHLVPVRGSTNMLSSTQMTLFPMPASRLLERYGVSIGAARRLYDRGVLSFDPDLAESLQPGEEAELSFLLSLLSAGCDQAVIDELLRELEPPYQLDVERTVFSFAQKTWLYTVPTDPELEVLRYIRQLQEEKNADSLASIASGAVQALRQLIPDAEE